VDNFVNIVGRNTGLQRARSDIKNLSRQAADSAHALLFFLVENRDVVSADEFLL
jgi:hypothetical protein